MKNTFKRIWNFFSREKKTVKRELWMTDKIIEIAKQSISDFEKKEVSAPIFYFPSHKMSFRKQQLVGKTYNTGKNRFRIHERISVANKFKYHIELLT